VTGLRVWILLALLLQPTAASAADCADKDSVATAISMQGIVEVRRAGQPAWVSTTVGDRYCAGDSVRVRDQSRAAVRLRPDPVLRLDQNTIITFTLVKDDPASWINIGRGIVHFISRTPRGLKVITPFVNGTVEGTEFVFDVSPDRSILTVFEGQVAAENPAGRLTVQSGQSIIARAGQPPTPLAVVRPRDAVQWALYYPSILDLRPEDFPDMPGVRRSIQAYRDGDIASAFAQLVGVTEFIRDPRFFTYRAVLLLSVGRVDEAKADLARALILAPKDPNALGLQSLIAVVQNERGRALLLARAAVDAGPRSAPAHVALSYAQQANFDLEGALQSVEEAVALDPQSGVAHARLAELRLSFGRVGEAVREANEAVRLSPDLARAHSVLGFTYLAQIKPEAAEEAFEKAIKLDPSDPLSRLGLGLARIQRGDLHGGRQEIEAAASLDPDNSLIRSYLGKAYYEEKRDTVAAEEFGQAKELDPNDPTPWFYDAIRKQTVNRPVEALHDLQRAIALNDNRAIYRSRLLLDEDLAARSISLARIYEDLGFQKLALSEGWKSVNLDPANYSAHRFLADSYSALPRHEIARVSELLQSQLLQPLNLNPVQPRLAARNLSILNSFGPSDPSFNEFTSLFNRNRFALQLSGLYGGNRTFGDEIVQSAVWQNLSYSLGQSHFETNGFRVNNDQRQDLYDIFAQAMLSTDTSVQAEFRSQKFVRGDLPLRFDPENFSHDLRQTDRIESIRFGARHSFGPDSTVIGSFIHQTGRFKTNIGDDIKLLTHEDGFTGEVQHLFRGERFSLVTGAGHTNIDRRDDFTFFDVESNERARVLHTNLYLYSLLNLFHGFTTTVGLSADFFEGGIQDRNQVNPKLGITWNPIPATTIRAAAFRTFKRTLLTNQTIEPTQVAGFNQFFDDAEATDSWRYGVGIDQKFSASVYGGAEVSGRKSEIPVLLVLDDGSRISHPKWREELARGYLYWTPTSWLAVSAEYQYEHLKRDDALDEAIFEVWTRKYPLAVSVFDPSGFRARMQATYVDQRGTFVDSIGESTHGSDRFWLVDMSIGYLLPRRLGLVTLEVRNLLDKRVRFQDTDPLNSQLYPERLILGKFTLTF
jgi:tetratricopeptide (TPR) repeat protein